MAGRRGQRFPGVTRIICAGEKLSATTREEAAGIFPHAELFEYYGASELGYVTVLRPHDYAEHAGSVGRAFLGARLSHAATVACLVIAGAGLSVGVLYWIGVAAVAALLIYEHALVRPNDLRRLNAAFFTMNGVISVAFAVFVIADAVSG